MNDPGTQAAQAVVSAGACDGPATARRAIGGRR